MVDAVQMILEIMRSGMGEAVEIGMGGLKLPAYAVDLPRPFEDDIANGKAQLERGGLFIFVPLRGAIAHAFLSRARMTPLGASAPNHRPR